MEGLTKNTFPKDPLPSTLMRWKSLIDCVFIKDPKLKVLRKCEGEFLSFSKRILESISRKIAKKKKKIIYIAKNKVLNIKKLT